jgi:hypothetical protein
MALIGCLTCKEKIDRNAQSCPFCGRPRLADIQKLNEHDAKTGEAIGGLLKLLFFPIWGPIKLTSWLIDKSGKGLDPMRHKLGEKIHGKEKWEKMCMDYGMDTPIFPVLMPKKQNKEEEM